MKSEAGEAKPGTGEAQSGTGEAQSGTGEAQSEVGQAQPEIVEARATARRGWRAGPGAPTRAAPGDVPGGGKAGDRRAPAGDDRRAARTVLAHIFVGLAALIFATPLIWALFSALKPNHEMFSLPPSPLASEVRWSNFVEVFRYGPFVTYIQNSFLVSIAGTILVLVVSTTAGYAFGRLRWRGRDVVFILFLATLMVPQEVLVVPMYQLMLWFGWVNTPQALVLPFAFTAFGTFLMRQFLRGIPYELEESARVDGAGPVRTFLLIILPLARPALAVLTVFTFISFWNSYLWPLIVISDYGSLGTLPIGLASFAGQFGTRWDLQMAATIISMIPTTIIVILLQKHLVKGIATAGLGGR